MNNVLSYCGLVDAIIRASDKKLLVLNPNESDSLRPYINIRCLMVTIADYYPANVIFGKS